MSGTMAQEIEIVKACTIFLSFAPLGASLLTLIFGKKFFREYSFVLPVIVLFLSFLASLKLLFFVLDGKSLSFDLYTLFKISGKKITVGFLIDSLSVLMVCMVLSLSFLIHVYSIGYMKGDPGFYRFFAYISLFTFGMLMLVLGNNLVQLFFGWEAVGLCSYLLIGFWYEKRSASQAAIKAFIVNRIGDFGFALGIFFLFYFTGSLHYHEIFEKLSFISHKYVVLGGLTISLPFLICFLLFMGAMGKSAQVPLHVWLPDAMEGPTPVSALIHAATMVTAGVYMVTRLHSLYLLSQEAMALVAFAGAFTCFMAATIAPTQFDIKRVIAFSTLSQLGYMFMACGVGAFAAGMFHLFTHAYFKALLFLGAGSVIHALHHAKDPNDIRIMGGLRKYMPITYYTFFIGACALSAFPGFSGFYSKELILSSAFYSHYPWGKFIWLVGLCVSFLTAFYTFRLLFRVFFGEFKGKEALHGETPKESPWVMTVPLILISIGALFAGMLDVPSFLEKGLHLPAEKEAHNFFLQALAISFSLSGAFIAYLVYLKKPELQFVFSRKLPEIYKFLYNKWYFDEVYQAVFVRGTLSLSRKVVYGFFDGEVIERVVNGVPSLISKLGSLLKKAHTGLVNYYVFFSILGAILYFLLFYLLK